MARAVGLLVIIGAVVIPAVAVSAPGTSELPNLAARPTDYVEISLSPAPATLGLLYLDLPGEPRVLRFNTKAANAGAFPLDVLGVPTTNALSLDAFQCVGWTGPACRSRAQVGAMEWHEAHRHWHFNDFALYELRRLRPDGSPDLSASGLIGQGSKASFCLMDTERDQAGGSLVGTYQTCSGVLQGISPTWADVYDASLPGQELPLEGVTDGRYALLITLDPDNRIQESNEADNTAWSVVEIYEQTTKARLVDGP